MTFSSDLQSVALRLLTTYGEPVTVTRPNTPSINPLTGIAIELSPTTYNGFGQPEKSPNKFINNEVVFETDIQLSFYSTTMPTPGDIFTIGGINYTAVYVDNVRAQGQDIMYTVQLKQ